MMMARVTVRGIGRVRVRVRGRLRHRILGLSDEPILIHIERAEECLASWVTGMA